MASNSPYNPFRPGIFSAVLIWLIVVTVIAAVNVAGVMTDQSEKVVACTMLVLAAWGHFLALFHSYCLNLEVVCCRRDLDRLLRLPVGGTIPETTGLFSSSLLQNMKYLESLGPDGDTANREALAELTGGKWLRKIGKIQALALALVSLGVVFTMLGFTIVGQKLSVAFAEPDVDLLAAVVDLMPAMATATVSSLLGGFLGGVSLMYIAALMEIETEAYQKSIRAILEFTDFS